MSHIHENGANVVYQSKCCFVTRKTPAQWFDTVKTGLEDLKSLGTYFKVDYVMEQLTWHCQTDLF